MNEDLERDIDNILNSERTRERDLRALSLLLEKLQAHKNHHLSLQAHMGGVTSYLTSVTLEWVTNKVFFAVDLPVLHGHGSGNESRKIPSQSETMELVRQRQPDWERRIEMSVHLAIRQHHKLPPLLLAGYQPWIHDEQHEKWGVDRRAMNDSLNLTGLEPTGTYWNLDDTGTQFYALDGQHRLMALLGLRELIKTGRLPVLDKNGKPRKNEDLSREEVIDYVHKETGENPTDIHKRLQDLMSEESIGVEIIPAVRQGENRADALRHLGQVFLGANESIQLSRKAQPDEADSCHIIARRLCREHELFTSDIAADGKTRLKVDTGMGRLPENSDCYTNLRTLAETVRRYLKANENLPMSGNYAVRDSLIAKGVRIRPAASMLDQGTQAMTEYFDRLSKIPSHAAFIRGRPAGEFRESRGGEDNVLFRPMIQIALAEALGDLAARNVSLESAVEKLGRQEKRGQLKLTERAGPWFGVACDPDGKMRRNKKSEGLCCRLFQHLLGGGLRDDSERKKLREDFEAARRIDPVSGDAINLEGRQVKKGEVELPDPWQ